MAALFLAAGLPGCDGCGKTEKPYTPFGVASTTTDSPAIEDAAVATVDAGPEKPSFVTRPALTAPQAAKRWTLEGRDLAAPAGRIFARGLGHDLDGDGKAEVVAWTTPESATPAGQPGELWLYPAEGQPKKLASLPGFVPSGPACSHEPTLTLTGPRSVTVDVRARCTAALLPRAPVRAVMVVSPLADRPVVVTLRVTDPAVGDPFVLSMDSTDRDGDGRDDARLTVRQKPACRSSAPELSCNPDPDEREVLAQLSWLDRTAGTSRDASEPSASIARLAAWELGRSKRKGTALGTLATVRNIRRLMSTLCAEGGVPRILEEDGSAFACAPLTVTLDRLLTSEVQSGLALGDVQASVGALDRNGWYFGQVPEKRRLELEKAVLQATRVLEPPTLASPSIQALPSAGKPRWSPLGFELSGALLAQSRTGLVRVAAAGATPEPVDADAGVAAWPLELGSDKGVALASVVAPCDRNDVLLELTDAEGKPALRPRAPLLSPRPGSCTGKRAPTLSVVPLGWKDQMLELVIAGQRMGPLTTSLGAGADRTWGSPRSPDGQHLVLPTSLGLLVLSQGKPELWRGAAIGDARRFSDCVVANGAKAVACLEGSAVRIAERP